MRRPRITLLALSALTAAVCAAPAQAGERAGPDLLNAPQARVPELSNAWPFRAGPLLVSGTDAYRDGEYLYQDYLFDDHGPDTGVGSTPPGVSSFAASRGDLFYPTDTARFANNAADLVEFRIKPTRDAIVYRVTLGAVLADDAAVVGIGIDSDRGGGAQVAWPRGAGITSPGLDRFVTAWGTGGEVGGLNGAPATPLPAGSVSIDRTTNQMTIRVPRALMDPGRATWHYVAGTGVWSGTGFARGRAGAPTATEPGSSNPAQTAPGVFNLAFRFAEPQPRGGGSWYEEGQAVTLGGGTTGDTGADVDFGRLSSWHSDGWSHPPKALQARIYPARTRLPEGVKVGFPEFGGALQPYIVQVPSSYDGRRPVGLTFGLHSAGGTYTQFPVFSPNQLRQFGEEPGRLYVSTLGRGPLGGYANEAEADFFEVFADVLRNFRVDRRRVAISGYSMGGQGTYRLGLAYPDLFSAAFTVVGPAAATQIVENGRWLPFLNWAGLNDTTVPIPGPRAQQARFDALGLRSQLWTYPAGHLNLALDDEWAAAVPFVSDAVSVRDPRRVDYAFVPADDRPALGLVRDHAYWVSGLRSRDGARGEVSARSSAFTYGPGQAGDPVTRAVTAPSPGAPVPSTVVGTAWDAVPALPPRNALDVRLENVGRIVVDGRRAGLTARRCLEVTVTSDGAAQVRLDLDAGRVSVRRGTCGPKRISWGGYGRGSVTLEAGAGQTTFAVQRGVR